MTSGKLPQLRGFFAAFMRFKPLDKRVATCYIKVAQGLSSR
jgi:hypothetical protein